MSLSEGDRLLLEQMVTDLRSTLRSVLDRLAILSLDTADERIQTWPLWVNDDNDATDTAGVWCGQDCPPQAENSQILEGGDFTLRDLHRAIAEHIAGTGRERLAE